MKFTYTTPNGRLTVEWEAEKILEAFAQLASVSEAFEQTQCGLCGSHHVRADERVFDKKRYFKVVCETCGAQLDMSQHQGTAGTLYPNRADKDGNAKPFGGWYIHERDADDRLHRHRTALRGALNEGQLKTAWEAVPPDLQKLLAREKDYRKSVLASAPAR